jgi:hypothetical protein
MRRSQRPITRALRVAARYSAAAVLGCLVVAGCADPSPLPSTTAAEIGVEYKYALFDHCGLDTVPIEFDGSEWRIEGPTGGSNPPQGFGNPVDEGVIMLLEPNVGLYRSSGGVERSIFREGPIRPKSSSYLIPCI